MWFAVIGQTNKQWQWYPCGGWRYCLWFVWVSIFASVGLHGSTFLWHLLLIWNHLRKIEVDMIKWGNDQPVFIKVSALLLNRQWLHLHDTNSYVSIWFNKVLLEFIQQYFLEADASEFLKVIQQHNSIRHINHISYALTLLNDIQI